MGEDLEGRAELHSSIAFRTIQSASTASFEVALMSVLRPESLGFHKPKRQQGMAFFITRSVSKECLGQGKNTAKASPSLTLRVVITRRFEL